MLDYAYYSTGLFSNFPEALDNPGINGHLVLIFGFVSIDGEKYFLATHHNQYHLIQAESLKLSNDKLVGKKIPSVTISKENGDYKIISIGSKKTGIKASSEENLIYINKKEKMDFSDWNYASITVPAEKMKKKMVFNQKKLNTKSIDINTLKEHNSWFSTDNKETRRRLIKKNAKIIFLKDRSQHTLVDNIFYEIGDSYNPYKISMLRQLADIVENMPDKGREAAFYRQVNLALYRIQPQFTDTNKKELYKSAIKQLSEKQILKCTRNMLDGDDYNASVLHLIEKHIKNPEKILGTGRLRGYGSAQYALHHKLNDIYQDSPISILLLIRFLNDVEKIAEVTGIV
ncbi:MAG: hypothetical protein GY821_03965 [Gammaproteobacteria bacterium]|nr:hypothetical protein [Gammaproteobacteria bacterium]